MTITLAAVYAPIGFQGGLTGALFREFAFTLAGAVFISGVVALTLSPMMSSRLLRAEHQHGWLARHVDRAFDAAQARLRARARRRRCASRPAVYAVWIVLVAAGRPDVHVLAEGARAERGPGRRLRRLDVPANATLEQVTTVHRRRSTRSSQSTPEFEHSFQITLPDRRLRRHAR